MDIDINKVILEGIAWIDTADVRAEGALQSLHIICVGELVIAVPIASELWLVTVRRQHQGGAAAPAAHHFGGKQFLFFGRGGVGPQISTKSGNVHMELAERDESAVVAQLLRNREIGGFPEFVDAPHTEASGT